MFIISSELSNFDEEKLKLFLANKIPEGFYLDY